MAISTILMCYCADEEMFPPEERFADGPLRSAIKTTQAAHDGKVIITLINYLLIHLSY